MVEKKIEENEGREKEIRMDDWKKAGRMEG
jgi:hypothetical protein